ncbi:hypothetical protein BJV82DRAFT_523424 [Fennellomyces sp. T-0311]|nr:hypothetical protein BJV82DRAFT_523424 [Fennellomyces sp. T-0311]
MPTPSLLACNNPAQLTELVARIVPSMWNVDRRHDGQGVFKRFCFQLLRVMEVSCSCTLLALYYIHRLKTLYPRMKTSAGFEVRVFTTALILASKYLEDYTFRSKTWSEVSSIPLHELNLMEAEFMSALQYNMHVHRDLFFTWTMQCQQQLFGYYYYFPTTPSKRKADDVDALSGRRTKRIQQQHAALLKKRKPEEALPVTLKRVCVKGGLQRFTTASTQSVVSMYP